MTAPPQPIRIDPPTAEAGQLWRSVLELAEAFGETGWTLVGGLMVQLYSFEHGSRLRPTADIDFLGDSRRRPPMTEHMAEVLDGRGAELVVPPVGDEKLGYRFELGGDVVEILSVDGLRRDPNTLGSFTTFQVPGGTQAISRTEVVEVSVAGDTPIPLRRPGLLGAILIKARAVASQRPGKFESDRQDLIQLLSFVEDPRGLAAAGELRASEREWLRRIEHLLASAELDRTGALDPGELQRAQQAYRLLVRHIGE